MKNSIGTSISVTVFGESHGEAVGAVADGLCPGIKIDTERIAKCLERRRPKGKISTKRVEEDEYRIISGVYRGYTTGTPLTVIIPNQSVRSDDYNRLTSLPRPGHADLSAEYKFHGYQDPRGGGHFSGRITAALVVIGAILESALEKKGIFIGTHICSLHGICDKRINATENEIRLLKERSFPTLSEDAEAKMTEVITEAAAVGDSVGGILESCIIGMPSGVGEPWFDTVEGELAHALFSIPGIKGVEFGAGFGFDGMYGSEANDPFALSEGKIVTKTNNNGGINGGITNGMPVIMRCAVKPTPSIFKEQSTVDLNKKEETTFKVEGRHDPAIIHRAAPVVDAVAAIVVADLLAMRYGTDYFLF